MEAVLQPTLAWNFDHKVIRSPESGVSKNDERIDPRVLGAERKNLFLFAMTRLRDADLAEDAVQETLVAALGALHRFERRSSLRTWLISILINKISDMIAKQGREMSIDEISQSVGEDDDAWFDEAGNWEPAAAPRSWSSPDKALEQRQFWGLFERCLQRMPARLAEVFVLREVMGESIEDICQTLGITASNCSVMLFRARATLRACLENNGFAAAA